MGIEGACPDEHTPEQLQRSVSFIVEEKGIFMSGSLGQGFCTYVLIYTLRSCGVVECGQGEPYKVKQGDEFLTVRVIHSY